MKTTQILHHHQILMNNLRRSKEPQVIEALYNILVLSQTETGSSRAKIKTLLLHSMGHNKSGEEKAPAIKAEIKTLDNRILNSKDVKDINPLANKQIALLCLFFVFSKCVAASPEWILNEAKLRHKERELIDFDKPRSKLEAHLVDVYLGNTESIDLNLFYKTLPAYINDPVIELRDEIISDFERIVDTLNPTERGQFTRQHAELLTVKEALKNKLIPNFNDCWNFTKLVRKSTCANATNRTTSGQIQTWLRDCWNSFAELIGGKVERSAETTAFALFFSSQDAQVKIVVEQEKASQSIHHP